MGRAILFVAIGLILLGGAGLLLFPDIRADILQRIPFLNQEPDGPVTLTYWGLWEPREVMQPLLDEYQQLHENITIEYEMRDPNTHYETLKTRFGGEGSPDIVRIHPTWIPFMKDKLMAIPTSVMTTEQYESTFFQVQTPLATQDRTQIPPDDIFTKQGGKYFGIPLMIDGLALVYNRDLFLAEGIPNPPQTWLELRDDMVPKLNKRDSQDKLVQSAIALGYANNIDYFADIIGLMFAQNGVRFVDSQGKVTLHTTTSEVGDNFAVDTLSFYSQFARKYKTWDPEWRNSTAEFAAGRVAMILIPSHRLHEILSVQPAFEIGVAPVPQLPQNEAVGWANYWVEGVSKASPNGMEAWKFLKWLTEKDQLTKVYRLAKDVRSFGEPYSRKDLSSSLSAETYVLPYVQQAETYTTWFFTTGTFNPNVNDKIITALANAIETIARVREKDLDIAGNISSVARQAQRIITAELSVE